MLKKIKTISENLSNSEIPKVFDHFGKKILPFYRREVSTRTTHGGTWDIEEEFIIGITNHGWAKYDYIFNCSSEAGVKNHLSEEIMTPLTYENILFYCNTIPELKEKIQKCGI